jgi:ribose transport system ATP-binding protein
MISAAMRPRLSVTNLAKRFAGTRALSGVGLEVAAGELRVIAGENGAGKSTLIRILSGVFDDYEGEIRIDGALERLTSPERAARVGVATIHQELSLVGALSVSDNLLLYQTAHALSIVDRRMAREHAARVLAEIGLDVDPETPVERLSLADRQLLEIARALTRKAKILILDEPTSALSSAEVERLFERLSAIRAGGTSVLYISHRMDEIFRLADRITVLRDGESVLERSCNETSPDELVRALLGRERRGAPQRPRTPESAPRLQVRALRAQPLVEAAFEVRPGEIVGVAGLSGSGAEALMAALFGATRAEHAELRLDETEYYPDGPGTALARGVAFAPGDRGLGVFPELDVVENATLASLDRYCTLGVVNRSRERADVRRESGRFALKAAGLGASASSLSGGNQQKLVLIRCLLTQPRLLLLDDPTRGVDIGAKHDVYAALEQLADSGVAILFRSTELDELTTVCDRILAITRGRICLELERHEFDRARLLAALMGSAA